MTAVERPGRPKGRTRCRGWAAVAVAVLVAFNLRTTITSVSPLMERLTQSLHLSGSDAAGLAATPVLCFGVVAPAAVLLDRRVGVRRSLWCAMTVLSLGLAARTVGSFPLLLFGTVVACGGIAVANILGPAYVKQVGGRSAGVLMGVYAATMNIAAAGASLLSPVVAAASRSWRLPLVVWAAPAALACVVGSLQLRNRDRGAGGRLGTPAPKPRAGSEPLPTTRKAWRGITRNIRSRHWTPMIAMTASQSVVYYSVLAWLPTVFENSGMSTSRAGSLLSVFALVGVPMTLMLPAAVTRARSRWPWVVGVTSLTAASLLGLVLAPLSAPLMWVILLGVGQGGIFALVMCFILLCSRSPEETVRLSLVAQMAGFIVAAIGPFVLGEVHAFVHNWRLPLCLLLFALLPQVVGGVRTAAGPRSPIRLAASDDVREAVG